MSQRGRERDVNKEGIWRDAISRWERSGLTILGAVQGQVVEIFVGDDLGQESGTGQALVDGLRRFGSLAELALAAGAGILHLLVLDHEHLGRFVVVLFGGFDAEFASLAAALRAGPLGFRQLVTPRFATQVGGRLPPAVRLLVAASVRWLFPWRRGWRR